MVQNKLQNNTENSISDKNIDNFNVINSDKIITVESVLLSLSFAYLSISLVAGSLDLYKSSFVNLIPNTKIGIIIGVTGILLSFLPYIKKNIKQSNFQSILFYVKNHLTNFNVNLYCTGLVLYLFSDWTLRRYTVFQGEFILGEMILSGLIGIAFAYTNILGKAIKVYPCIISLVAFLTFWNESKGRLLFSDDNSTFFYRLTLLKEQFPNIPFYNPLWNGGIDARDFFASGSLNIFILFSPFIYFFDLLKSYNFIVASLLFFILPISIFFSAKIIKSEKYIPYIASGISVITNLLWYRWALKYGTLGFITSIVLFPLVLAYSIKIVSEKEISYLECIIFIALTSLMLFWTPSGIILLPIIIIGISKIKKLIKNKKIVLIVISLLFINLPWMTIFWSVSKVSSFIQAEKKSVTVTTINNDKIGNVGQKKTEVFDSNFRHKQGLNLKKSFKTFREHAISTNPLILLLLIPGLFLLPKTAKLPLIITFSWLFFLGTFMVPIKPQLELDRMLIVICILGSIPTAYAINKLFDIEENEKNKNLLVSEAIILKSIYFINIFLISCYMFSSTHILSGIIRNKSIEKYFFADSSVSSVSDIISQYSENGRTLFSGFTLHELSGGHLAPLTVFTDKPIMASSYVHNLWAYKQIFPEEYISQNDLGIEDYLNTYNVSLIDAHESVWIKYFRERTEKYTEIKSVYPFVFFQRKNYTSNWYYKGSGENLAENLSSINFIPKESEVILKFNYFPFLQSNNCILKEFKKSEHVSLIALSNCEIGKETKIDSITPFKRII